VFNAAPLPKPSQGAWHAPSLSHAFSNSYIESSGSHVSAASVIAPISPLHGALLGFEPTSIKPSPSLHHSSVIFWKRLAAFKPRPKTVRRCSR